MSPHPHHVPVLERDRNLGLFNASPIDEGTVHRVQIHDLDDVPRLPDPVKHNLGVAAAHLGFWEVDLVFQGPPDGYPRGTKRDYLADGLTQVADERPLLVPVPETHGGHGRVQGRLIGF
jgi:hypothetical protein